MKTLKDILQIPDISLNHKLVLIYGCDYFHQFNDSHIITDWFRKATSRLKKHAEKTQSPIAQHLLNVACERGTEDLSISMKLIQTAYEKDIEQEIEQEIQDFIKLWEKIYK